jgi:GT2 family glycosyltransferase
MELSIILVNYNDRRHIEACLSSLQENVPSVEHEIIVVDNASTDGSRELIARSFPAVRLIANADNAGFSRANNIGAKDSRGEFLLFLNTDTVVTPGSIGGWLDHLGADPSIGAAGPALLRKGGAVQVSFGKKVNFPAQLWQKLFLNPVYRRLLKKSAGTRSVGWLSAACLLCRRKAFEQVGGFDENFFIYFEDIDLCLRLREAGWKLVYIPGTRIFHEGGATTAAGAPGFTRGSTSAAKACPLTSPRRDFSRYQYRKSQLSFYRKHSPGISLSLLRASLKVKLVFLFIRGAFRGEEGARLRRLYRELLRKDPERG